ncbi:MAG: hypothetical protein JOS17DRAFT_37913 [Linnemannia elongata]|nr:MAG: hypothetical protein JOS17DRAFT_37913 [Linnemannia elongata]
MPMLNHFFLLSRGSNCTPAWFLLFMFWLLWLPCLYTCVPIRGTTNDNPARKGKKTIDNKNQQKGHGQILSSLVTRSPSFLPSPLVAPLTSVSLLFFLACPCFGLTPLNQFCMVCAFFLPKPEIEPKCPFISHGVYTQMYIERRRRRPRKSQPILLHLHPLLRQCMRIFMCSGKNVSF